MVFLFGRRGRFRFRSDASGDFALANRCRGRRCNRRAELLLVISKVRHVRLHLLVGFRRIDGGQRLAIRHIENTPRPDQVDVAADECVLVRAVQRDQHLIERYAIWLIPARDGAQGVAFLHFFLLRAGGHRRCRNGARFGARHGLARRRDCNRRGPWLRYRDRRSGDRLRSPIFGRIEQERVLAHQPPRGPLQFNQKIQERFVHRLHGRQPNDRPVAALVDCKLQADQRRTQLDTSLAERLRRGEAR